MSLDRPSSPPPQHLEESGSEVELDSPPRLTLLKIPEYEPRIPTSPPGTPPAPIVVDNERHQPFWCAEDDPYLKYLEDKFIMTAKDVYEPPEDDIDRKAASQRQSDGYAESALKYYNNDENNKVKYELISAIRSCGILDIERCYGHVNFIAKGNRQNSKEELFFAELRLDTYVPTCVLSLEGVNKVGGLCDSKYDKFHGTGIHIDAQHCYACGSGLMHPKNGLLYETGHVACSGFYHL